MSESASPADRIEALTDDQRAGLAHVLYAAQRLDTLSHSTRLAGVELEALTVRTYANALPAAAARIAQLPAEPDELGRELVLVHLELEPAGNFWGARGKLWDPERTKYEVHVLDQPARSLALAIALVQFARSVVGEAAGSALERFSEALGTACDELEDSLYPEPTLEQKVATMRERHEASLSQQEPGEPDPSFHGDQVD